MSVQTLLWGVAAGAILGAAFVAMSYVSFLLERRRRARQMFQDFGPLPHVVQAQAHTEADLPDNVISLAQYRNRGQVPAERIIDEKTARAMHPSMRGLQSNHAGHAHR